MIPLSFYVSAQDSDSTDVEEVVVKGIKSSLKDAINIKRSNVGVVDALTAEDLGKFPDGNSISTTGPIIWEINPVFEVVSTIIKYSYRILFYVDRQNFEILF